MTGLPHTRATPRKRRNMLENIFFILLVLTAGFILLKSPVFEVRRVQVAGYQSLEEEKIRAAANIGLGTNIFKVNLNEAAADIKMIPLIKDVCVRRALPAAIVIEVSEREPLGLLPAGDGFVEVDAEGVCLRKASAAVPGLPLLTGVQAALPALGEPVQAANLKETLSVIAGLPAEVVRELSEVHAGESGQVVLYTLDNVQCRFGLPENISEKGQVFTQVLKEVRRQGAKIQYLDLSCAGSPVVYYKQNSGGGTR